MRTTTEEVGVSWQVSRDTHSEKRMDVFRNGNIIQKGTGRIYMPMGIVLHSVPKFDRQRLTAGSSRSFITAEIATYYL